MARIGSFVRSKQNNNWHIDVTFLVLFTCPRPVEYSCRACRARLLSLSKYRHCERSETKQSNPTLPVIARHEAISLLVVHYYLSIPHPSLNTQHPLTSTSRKNQKNVKTTTKKAAPINFPLIFFISRETFPFKPPLSLQSAAVNPLPRQASFSLQQTFSRKQNEASPS